MISPVVVEARDGVAIARCVDPNCTHTQGTRLLYSGTDGTLRAAEQAADRHLKAINKKGHPHP